MSVVGFILYSMVVMFWAAVGSGSVWILIQCYLAMSGEYSIWLSLLIYTAGYGVMVVYLIVIKGVVKRLQYKIVRLLAKRQRRLFVQSEMDVMNEQPDSEM